MKQMEIISVRTSGNAEQQAFAYMRMFCWEVKAPLLSGASFCVNALHPGDLAVILTWQAAPSIEQKTDVGLTLADALKRFGLVDHTCWRVIENQ